MDNKSIVSVKKMPVYRPNIWGDYKAVVRPAGIRRFVSSVPFLNGMQLKYVMTVYNNSPNKEELHYNWILRRLAGDHQVIVEQGRVDSSVPAKGKSSQELDIAYITYKGDYIFDMRFNGQQRDSLMASFELIGRDMYMVKWMTGGIGAAIGAAVAFTITRLSGC